IEGGWKKKNPPPVPIITMDGEDDSGMGMAGSGGDPNPLAVGEAPKADIERLQLPTPLENVKEDLNKKLQMEDPTSALQIPDAAAAALGALDQTLQEKILGIGQKKGNGPGAGSGDGASGTGNGGFGSDSTRARGLRWVLRFRTNSGKDYLAQMNALKAVVMIPVPPENKRMLVFKNLNNPGKGENANDADLGEVSNKIQFMDIRKASVEAIQEALRLDFTPSAVWAFFPKDMEEEMSRLEVSYQNKRSEDIKETVYQVIVVGGTARLNVISQKLK
ncbi:MAG: hypothetical protein ACRCZF_22925, partial [Gemmataceae bacterium]